MPVDCNFDAKWQNEQSFPSNVVIRKIIFIQGFHITKCRNDDHSLLEFCLICHFRLQCQTGTIQSHIYN